MSLKEFLFAVIASLTATAISGLLQFESGSGNMFWKTFFDFNLNYTLVFIVVNSLFLAFYIHRHKTKEVL